MGTCDVLPSMHDLHDVQAKLRALMMCRLEGNTYTNCTQNYRHL